MHTRLDGRRTPIFMFRVHSMGPHSKLMTQMPGIAICERKDAADNTELNDGRSKVGLLMRCLGAHLERRRGPSTIGI